MAGGERFFASCAPLDTICLDGGVWAHIQRSICGHTVDRLIIIDDFFRFFYWQNVKLGFLQRWTVLFVNWTLFLVISMKLLAFDVTGWENERESARIDQRSVGLLFRYWKTSCSMECCGQSWGNWFELIQQHSVSSTRIHNIIFPLKPSKPGTFIGQSILRWEMCLLSTQIWTIYCSLRIRFFTPLGFQHQCWHNLLLVGLPYDWNAPRSEERGKRKRDNGWQ